MKYKATRETLATMKLWQDWPGIDDHEIHALLMLENNKIDSEAYIQTLITRHKVISV